MRKKLPRETIIKFDVICLAVEDPEKFLKNIKGMCEYYNTNNKNHPPIIKYRTEEGAIIRKKTSKNI